MQAEQQLPQTHDHLQQTIPAQQEHCELVRELQAMQCACWNGSLSAELSGLDIQIYREDGGRIVPTAARHNRRNGADQV